MIAAPPSETGAAKVTDACVLPAVAVPMVGAPGTVEGVTLFDAEDAGPLPIPFVAVTVKVYAVPLARPATRIAVHGAVQAPVNPPGEEVAVKLVIAAPPSEAGAANVTEACALPPVAVPMTGAPGIVAGVTVFEEAEGAPGPLVFTALTVNEYAVPLARPVTGIEVHGAVQLPLKLPGEDVAV